MDKTQGLNDPTLTGLTGLWILSTTFTAALTAIVIIVHAVTKRHKES